MSNGAKFPKTGRSWADIEGDLDRLVSNESFWRPENRLMTGIHKGSPETFEIIEKAYMKLFHYNGLLADMEHGGVGRMQDELLGWTADLLNGGKDARASMMTGGTEAIFCGLHAAREWAKATRPDIKGPYQVVAPWSIHATFSKGAHYLGLEVIRVPLGDDLRGDVAAMEKAITPNTIMLAGSAPSWGIGRVDPIEQIAKLAKDRGLWMHVDACVGGFLLPFMERCGEDIPLWDFRVPGVCTISADLHKHGYAAKPASTLSFRNEELQNYSFAGAVVSDWQSGAYKSHGFVGSRPGGAISAAWAVMSYLGEEGYTKLTRKLIDTRNWMIEEIESIEDYKVLRNHCLMMPFRSETLDMLRVLGGLVERGYFPWGTMEPLMVHPSAELVDESVNRKFIADLKEVTSGVKSGEITAEALATYI
ncbi:MAG: aminotransferase class V-fold PLP-dependent enzyme [Parvularculaceae bacterium]